MTESLSPEASLPELSGRTSLCLSSQNREQESDLSAYEYSDQFQLLASRGQTPLNITGDPVVLPAAASSDQTSPKRPSPKRPAPNLSPLNERSAKSSLFLGPANQPFNEIKFFTTVPLRESDFKADMAKLEALSEEIADLRDQSRLSKQS